MTDGAFGLPWYVGKFFDHGGELMLLVRTWLTHLQQWIRRDGRSAFGASIA